MIQLDFSRQSAYLNYMRKSIYIFLILSIIAVTSCSENSEEVTPSNIPTIISQKFQESYPDSKDVKWFNQKGLLEAEFEINGLDKAVVFNSEGVIVKTETEIETNRIPSRIAEYLAANYADNEVLEAEITEEGNSISYEVDLQGEDSDEEIELTFDDQGNFLSMVVEEDEEDEDDENEREISPSELPQIIKSAIASKYAGAEMVEADEVTQANGQITYDVELKLNGEIKEVMFDAKGEFLGVESDD